MSVALRHGIQRPIGRSKMALSRTRTIGKPHRYMSMDKAISGHDRMVLLTIAASVTVSIVLFKIAMDGNVQTVTSLPSSVGNNPFDTAVPVIRIDGPLQPYRTEIPRTSPYDYVRVKPLDGVGAVRPIGDDFGSKKSATPEIIRSDRMASVRIEDHPGRDFPLPMAKSQRVVVMVKPRPRPNRLVEGIKDTARSGRDAVVGGLRALGDLAKRTVTGNGGRVVLEPRTKAMFVELERRWGERLVIRWAYRDKSLNRKVGGATRSMHLRKQAIDIVHGGWSREKMRRFVRLAYKVGFRGFGLGGNVVHIDSRAGFTSWNYGGNRYGSAAAMLR